MSRSYLFTSESVSEGHPDKVCDRISDMVVDTYLGACLLYTSDAADDMQCVDLGGRRII